METPAPTAGATGDTMLTIDDYHRTVGFIAGNLRHICRGGFIRSAEGLREAAEHAVQMSRCFHNPDNAIKVLGFSGNADAAEDALGWSGLVAGCHSFDEMVHRKAYYALLADVEALLVDIHFDEVADASA